VTVPSLSVVIPAYNESARLSSTLAAVISHLSRSETELIVVDDGSSDDTAELARRTLADTPRAKIIALPTNRGKGAAVRTGVLAAAGDAILFMDADLATDLGALDDVMDALATTDVVVGSRSVPGAVVHNGTTGRALMGRGFNRLVRLVTGLDVHDTQCGFKAFRGDAARLLFGLSSVDGFAFDAEILYVADTLGLRIRELPVVWTAVDGSSVRPFRDSLRTALDLVRVRLHRRRATVRTRASALGWTPERADAGDARPSPGGAAT